MYSICGIFNAILAAVVALDKCDFFVETFLQQNAKDLNLYTGKYTGISFSVGIGHW